MKIPYGLSDFSRLRTEEYFYVDKTRYIELLESLPERHVIFLRSRRFGKTLFANMLGWYYDMKRAQRFEELFRGTYIFDHPTPGRNASMLLTFNFSGINTETLKNANEDFTEVVRNSVNVFLEQYHDDFTANARQRILRAPRPNDILNSLFEDLKGKSSGKKVFVIIDEYDHFANNILSQGKAMFKDLVKTDGHVRPFYETLKKGTETIVDRIFITGVMPILLDSLTSGFNIAMNLSTDDRFNAMLGFTDDEITPILEYLDQLGSRDAVRTYYDGYRFSPNAEQNVYNSDMILYYALKQSREKSAPRCLIDRNVVSDYRKIRAILSIGDKSVEEEILTRIVRDRRISVNEIAELFTLTQETEFLFDSKALVSLLFYMGYLTIVDRRGLEIVLAMPNMVLESLYLEYLQSLLMRKAEIRIDGMKKDEMIRDLTKGNIDLLVELTENLLAGLSNRDYQKFDEKYIKLVMLSFLSDVGVYIPRSEFELGSSGYADLYLQAAYEPRESAHYLVELKYVKAKATKKDVENREREGRKQMRNYLKSGFAQNIPNLMAYVLVFRKDRCVKKSLIDLS